MSKKWKIVLGVVAVAAVILLVTLTFVGRLLIFRGRGVPFGRGFDPRGGRHFDRGFDAERGLPFGRGSAPHRGMPFGRSFGPGRFSRFGPFFGPFAILGGLAHLGFLGLLIGLAVAFVCRYRRRESPYSPASAPGDN